MSEQKETAVQQSTERQLVNALREGTRKTVIDNKLSFNVVFTALSQLASQFVFDYVLLNEGELTEEGVNANIAKFNELTEAAAKEGLANIRKMIAEEEEAATPKIITSV